MRRAPVGSLAKPPGSSFTLQPTPQSKRLTAEMHDLITIAYERCTNRRSNSLTLTRLEYVSGEKQDEKFSMHFDALVKEAALPENVPLQVTIIVEVIKCSEQF